MSASFHLSRVADEVAGTRFSGQIQHLTCVESTNDLALAAAAAGIGTGVWVADEQTAGRGRGGHSWHSAPGDGLYVSVLMTPQLPLDAARWLPLAVGLAVRAAVLRTTGLELDLRWPNDLMFAERKCGGILVESAGLGAMLRFAVIGIGLNLNHAAFPPELAAVATSLFLESSREFEREPLLAAMLVELDRELADPAAFGSTLERRFAAVSSWYTGKRVRVGAEDGPHGGYTGWTRGLTPEGFMQVEADDGTLRIVHSGGLRAVR